MLQWKVFSGLFSGKRDRYGKDDNDQRKKDGYPCTEGKARDQRGGGIRWEGGVSFCKSWRCRESRCGGSSHEENGQPGKFGETYHASKGSRRRIEDDRQDGCEGDRCHQAQECDRRYGGGCEGSQADGEVRAARQGDEGGNDREGDGRRETAGPTTR